MCYGMNMNKTKYFFYHNDNEHMIELCQKLKDELEFLIWKGYLKEYVNRDNQKEEKMIPNQMTPKQQENDQAQE